MQEAGLSEEFVFVSSLIQPHHVPGDRDGAWFEGTGVGGGVGGQRLLSLQLLHFQITGQSERAMQLYSHLPRISSSFQPLHQIKVVRKQWVAPREAKCSG